MKYIKQILAITLALAMGLALLIPAMAATEVDPNAPVITRQPSGPTMIVANRTIVLEVAAELPTGIQGELSVAWYARATTREDPAEQIATGARAEISSSSLGLVFESEIFDDIFMPGGEYEIYAVVTNTYIDMEGQERQASVTSNAFTVYVAPSPINILSVYWNMAWSQGILMGLILFPLAMFLGLGLALQILPIYLMALSFA